MLFFVGMPGTGKSYWASTIATAHDLPFIDLDSVIEDKVKMNIADYFEKCGEDEFRKREQEALLHLIANCENNTVIACGGGTPVFFDNLQQMQKAGCVIYLKATINAIMQRLANSSIRRPLLEGKDLPTALMELYNRREPFFSQADHIFDVESISLTNFTEIIPSCTNRP